MKYDVVYSVTAHECIDCVYNLYQNIMKLHEGYNVLVIFHLNIDLYNKKEVLPEHDNLRYHPRPVNKEKYKSDIFFAHLANYNHVRDESFDLFCTLASNCLFVRRPDIEAIKDSTPTLNMVRKTGYNVPDSQKWLWDTFLLDEKIAAVFKDNDIELVAHSHEGAYFRKMVINYIFYFCVTNHITKDNFTKDEAWSEETILPSLEKYATDIVSKRYCGLIPEINARDIISIAKKGSCWSLIGDHFTIVKVPRDMNNELRILVNNL